MIPKRSASAALDLQLFSSEFRESDFILAWRSVLVQGGPDEPICCTSATKDFDFHRENVPFLGISRDLFIRLLKLRFPLDPSLQDFQRALLALPEHSICFSKPSQDEHILSELAAVAISCLLVRIYCSDMQSLTRHAVRRILIHRHGVGQPETPTAQYVHCTCGWFSNFR